MPAYKLKMIRGRGGYNIVNLCRRVKCACPGSCNNQYSEKRYKCRLCSLNKVNTKEEV